MRQAIAFAIGLVFGIGLIVSGMADPGKVKGFLDLLGPWDPSLMFVMGGAVAVAAVAFALARRRTQALLGGAMRVPQRRDIDRDLLVGSALFGVGWGLAGFCPGPAFVALGAGYWQAGLFVAAMVAGMLLHDRPRAARTAAEA